MFNRILIALAVVIESCSAAPGVISTQVISGKAADTLIIGGNEAESGQFPYMSSLRTAANSHICGAAIINSRWVLTGAHCVAGRTSNGLRVVVGTLSLTTGGIAHTSARHETHPAFDPSRSNSTNDVGLVKTVTTIVFNAVTQPIRLGESILRGGENALFSGWGASDRNELIPRNKLQWMRTTTITNFDCKSKLEANGEDSARITDQTICTFFSKTVSLCYYDKGGPLVVDGKVVAIANKQACEVGTPDSFTRILSFLDWIVHTIDEPTK